MRWITRQQETDPSDPALGGKARALAALTHAGFAVPPFFVVRPSAFVSSAPPFFAARMAAHPTWAEMQHGLATLAASLHVRREIEEALDELVPGGERVAVRSSAVDEDGAYHSFAGQLESYLNVPPDQVAARTADVWRSGFSERIVAYRRENRLAETPEPPAVLVQRLVDADSAGVAFSADPVSGQRAQAVVAAVHGLGTALVSGDADADTFRVDRRGQISARSIAVKARAQRLDPDSDDGLRWEDLDGIAARSPALTDAQVAEVAALARRAEAFFGRPQDIEWAYTGGTLFLLQSRPITSLILMPDPDGARAIWDNSNISESYGGVTTPLTFTFARRAYEEVYQEFCRLMGVPADTIAANKPMFAGMIGLIRGRIYYNLLNWYRMLALLPGFQVNRRFMEQMMGVKEPIPDDILAPGDPVDNAARRRDSIRLARTVVGLLAAYATLGDRTRRFRRRLDLALRSPVGELDHLRPDELTAHYGELEQRLLTRWDAPLINDFFAMIFYGVLRRMIAVWCGDTSETLQNDLLLGQGGMISAEPAQRVRTMAELAARDLDLIAALSDGNTLEFERVMRAYPQFAAEYREYLDKFGDRCLNELKLESPTLDEDPGLLLRSIGHLAAGLRSGSSKPAESKGETPVATVAEAQVNAALRGRPMRLLAFRWVLGQTRRRLRDRENLRFERTRVFGRVRRIFAAVGRQFVALDVLDAWRDIFFLTVEEIRAFIDGTAPSTDLRGLTRLRRAEFERYAAGPAPADRFETRGVVYVANDFRPAKMQDAPAGDLLQGLGCCPGVVRGRARIIHDPRGATIFPGEILVAERTDPGWIMMFAVASGIAVERGSLLSHSAIVSREMGIPSVVAIPGLISWLETGDLIEVDGKAGTVRRIEQGDDSIQSGAHIPEEEATLHAE